MRNELYLRSRTGVRASFLALTCAEGSESSSSRPTEGKLSWSDGAEVGSLPARRVLTQGGQHLEPQPMMMFMTLPPYTRISEGEVHSRGLGVRNCSHRARSRPLSEQSESIGRACEATSAEGIARCTSVGNPFQGGFSCPRAQKEAGTLPRGVPSGSAHGRQLW